MVTLEQIPVELIEKLAATRMVAVRFSSNVNDPAMKVDDAVLLNKKTEIDVERLNGYTISDNFKYWFDLVVAPYGDDVEKAIELVKGAVA